MKTTLWLVLELDPDAASLLGAAFARHPASAATMVLPPFIHLSPLATRPASSILLALKHVSWPRLDVPDNPDLIRSAGTWGIPISAEVWSDYRRRILEQLPGSLALADPDRMTDSPVSIPLLPAIFLALDIPGAEISDSHSKQRIAPSHPVRVVQPRLSVLSLTADNPGVRPWMVTWGFHGGHRVSKARPLP